MKKMASLARPRRQQAAFTLLELLLVMGLLVILAALSWPALRGPLGSSRLREAAKIVRVELAKTRLQAMQNDAILQWQFSPGEGRFRVGVVREAPVEEEDVLSSNEPEDETQRWSEFQLPEGIVFGEPEVTASPGASDWDQLSDENWSSPIVFYPNGTTSNAELVLRNEREDSVVISLRGLTGVSRVTDVPQERTPLR